MKHTISAIVENEFGVLARIAGLFSGRGYNIQSLTVAETLDPKVSRLTLVTEASGPVIEQIMKQLRKLINVISVKDMTGEAQISRILSLVKIQFKNGKKPPVKSAIKQLKGTLLVEDKNCCVAEFTGDEKKIATVISKLKKFGILEFEKTGKIAIQKGIETFNS